MRTFLRFARKAAFNYFWSLGIGIAPIVALLTLWDDPGSSVFVLTAIGPGLVIAGVYIVITAATGVPAGGSACSGLRTRPPGSGSSGDGNVGGPKVEIASELVGLFPQDVRLWRLAPRLRMPGIGLSARPRCTGWRQAHRWEGEKMPKVSKATASSHQPIPGVLDAYSHEIDGWTISMETHLNDLDAAFLFKGAPNDQCQAPHMGYVLKGKYGMRIADGVEEVFEAGDAFFIGPGHTPIIFAGCEIVYFTRTEDANRELPVAMANLMKYMEEQGMEVPATPQPSPQLSKD